MITAPSVRPASPAVAEAAVLLARRTGIHVQAITVDGVAYVLTTGTGETSYGPHGACAFAYDADDVAEWLAGSGATYQDLCDEMHAVDDRALAIAVAVLYEARLTRGGSCAPVLTDDEYHLVRAGAAAAEVAS